MYAQLALRSTPYSKEFVSKRTAIVSSTLSLEDVINVKIDTTYHLILFASPNNQDVSTKMVNAPTATTHSSSTTRPRNAESRDVTKPTTPDAPNANTRSRKEKVAYVESLTVPPYKITTVSDVRQATTSSKDSLAQKTTSLA